MKIVRIVSACIAFFVGALALIFGLLHTFGPSLASKTIEHNKQIEQSFRLASHYVSTFKETNGRLPSKQEFEDWASGHPSTPYSIPNGMWIEVKPFPDEAIKKFGKPTDGSYLLVYWRGEWFEYYASWIDRTSLEFDESKYYALGNKYADGSVVLLLGLCAILLGRKMWPNPSFQRTAFGGR
jgi:hypothetical protein